jgi:hypothetical protein
MGRRALRLATAVPQGIRTAAECEARLEASELYRRREYESRLTEVRARLSALWYGDPQFRERYWEAKS